MVRLRVANIHPFLSLLLEFQFQYGTIERLYNGKAGDTLGVFQFQYGTIEREQTLLFPVKGKEFQFQYGTIEST